jgi:hypothetical protein
MDLQGSLIKIRQQSFYPPSLDETFNPIPKVGAQVKGNFLSLSAQKESHRS